MVYPRMLKPFAILHGLCVTIHARLNSILLPKPLIGSIASFSNRVISRVNVMVERDFGLCN
eukprot:UN32844